MQPEFLNLSNKFALKVRSDEFTPDPFGRLHRFVLRDIALLGWKIDNIQITWENRRKLENK